jgi:hypothetical protein
MLAEGTQGRLSHHKKPSPCPIRYNVSFSCCISDVSFHLLQRWEGAETKDYAMTNAIQELKTRAEILHKQIKANDPAAIGRLRMLKRSMPDREHAATVYGSVGIAVPYHDPTTIKRRDCLNLIARELGFPDWPHAKLTIAGEGDAQEFGILLYRGGGHINCWYVGYDEASADRANCQGYLLAYKRDFLVVDRYFIESLGLHPDDPDWAAIGFDWVRPKSLAARTRLYDKLIATLPREHYRSNWRSRTFDYGKAKAT